VHATPLGAKPLKNATLFGAEPLKNANPFRAKLMKNAKPKLNAQFASRISRQGEEK